MLTPRKKPSKGRKPSENLEVMEVRRGWVPNPGLPGPYWIHRKALDRDHMEVVSVDPPGEFWWPESEIRQPIEPGDLFLKIITPDPPKR